MTFTSRADVGRSTLIPFVVRLALPFGGEEASQVMMRRAEIQRLFRGAGIFVQVIRPDQIGPEGAHEVITRCGRGGHRLLATRKRRRK